MSDFEPQPERPIDRSEAIAASMKFSEWMGLLMAEHAAHIEKGIDGSESLALSNAHIRNVEYTRKPTRAVITSQSIATRPRLELAVQTDPHTAQVTSVLEANPKDEYYTTSTVNRVVDTYGVTQIERVDEPHAVTQTEVNSILNEVAKLRPPQSETSSSQKKAAFGHRIARILRLFGGDN